MDLWQECRQGEGVQNPENCVDVKYGPLDGHLQRTPPPPTLDTSIVHGPLPVCGPQPPGGLVDGAGRRQQPRGSGAHPPLLPGGQRRAQEEKEGLKWKERIFFGGKNDCPAGRGSGI